jgi:aspartyl/glutamyl-tRNA(Asn/Gln) amidotransferase C subunit
VFDHLVDLAAMELGEDEKQYLRQELNQQLQAIQELEAIQVDDSTPITSHGVPYAPGIRPALREDEIEPCPEADDIVERAPDTTDRYIVVPDIPHEDLK